MVKRKRNIPVYVRLSADEYRKLMEKVEESGQTIQSYIIHTALEGRVSSSEEVQEIRRKNQLLEDIDKQLRGMGTNLNQMAHVANGQGRIPSAEKLVTISNEVNQIRSEVNEEWLLTRQSISQQKVTER